MAFTNRNHMHPKSDFRARAIAGALFAALVALSSHLASAQDNGNTATFTPNTDGRAFNVETDEADQRTASSSSHNAPEQTTTSTQKLSSCPEPHGVPDDDMFRDLESVNLYLDIPQNLQDAVACHGHEMQCAGGYGNAEEYARRLVADYDAYPAPLHPDNLTTLFANTLSREILPYVQKGEHCEDPAVHVLAKPSLFTDVYKSHSLTVTVKLTMDNAANVTPDVHAKPTLAVLSLLLFRPDRPSYDHQVLLTSVIPLPVALADADINERLAYFIKRANLHVPVIDPHNRPTPAVILHKRHQ